VKTKFRIPKILFGSDTAQKVGWEVQKFRGKRPLIVTDSGIVKAGLLKGVENSIVSAGAKTIVHDEVEPNPKARSVERGAELFRVEKCDVIVVLGGGSPIDTAKGIGVMTTNDGSILDYQEGRRQIKNPTPPLIAIPTTAGTGSEVTCAALITDAATKRKVYIISPFLLPDLAILDPLMTVGLPPKLTAGTGADALTHAIEAYVSTRSNSLTDIIALQAIKLIGANLREAVANGKNVEARSNMMLASTMAGIAFAAAGVGIIHPMAHAVGGYFDLPHGVLCGILLTQGMEYNSIADPYKFGNIALSMGGNTEGLPPIKRAKRAVEAVNKLLSDVGIPQNLKNMGVKRETISELADIVMLDKICLECNPRKVSKEEIIEIFEKIF